MQANDIEPKLSNLLNNHKHVPERDPQASARGRARFLEQAAQLREAAFQQGRQRRNGWVVPLFRRPIPALQMIASALILLSLFFGATIVFASNNDLPTEPLYGVKTLSEDVSLWLAADPTTKMERLLGLAQLRVQEMTALAEQGVTIPAMAADRLHGHIETALQLAAGQSDAEMQTSLWRIHTQLETQEETMTQLQNHASAEQQPAIKQIRVVTQEQLRLAILGLEDPTSFRDHYHLQGPANISTSTSTLTSIPPETATPLPFGNGQGTQHPQSTPEPPGTGTPGNGNGPGGSNTTPGGGGGGAGGGGGGGGGGGSGGGGGGNGKP